MSVPEPLRLWAYKMWLSAQLGGSGAISWKQQSTTTQNWSTECRFIYSYYSLRDITAVTIKEETRRRPWWWSDTHTSMCRRWHNIKQPEVHKLPWNRQEEYHVYILSKTSFTRELLTQQHKTQQLTQFVTLITNVTNLDSHAACLAACL